MFALRVFMFCASVGVISCATNYCNSNLCPPGKKHIACGNSGSWSPACPSDRKMLQLSDSQINDLLDQHNHIRNKIANGEVDGYSAASRMATMTWNAELAKLAALNVKQCQEKHDSCHNTPLFKSAGQNLAWTATTGDFPSAEQVIKSGIKSWFDEKSNGDQSTIDNCCDSTNGGKILHFTQMAQDNAIQVGCAISQYTQGEWKSSLMACNYAVTNLYGTPVYVSGDSASGCKSGTNSKYSSLCSTSEKINPNEAD